MLRMAEWQNRMSLSCSVKLKFSPGLLILDLSLGEVTLIMTFVTAAEFVAYLCK